MLDNITHFNEVSRNRRVTARYINKSCTTEKIPYTQQDQDT